MLALLIGAVLAFAHLLAGVDAGGTREIGDVIVVSDARITLDFALYTAIGSFVIPLVVAFVAARRARAWVKTTVNVVCSALLAALLTFTVDGPLASAEVAEFLLAFVTAVIGNGAVYRNVWEPLGVAHIIQEKFPKGIGAEAKPSRRDLARADRFRDAA